MNDPTANDPTANDLGVELESPEASFRPGEAIQGTASWSLYEAPDALEVRLFWFTQGKGDQDVGVIDTTTLDGAGREGSRDFTFTAPAAPLSFSGKLISLTWAVELVALPAGEAARRELVLSHTGEEIRIDNVDGEAEAAEPTVRARDNPFRADRVESLAYRAPGFAWPELLARLRCQGGRGAIRGRQGSGKTTLLHELGDRLETEGWAVRRLRPDLDDRKLASEQLRSFSRGADQGTALLLDGADRLGLLRWNRFVRAAASARLLVVTTHREGRLPTLHRCATSSALLVEIVRELAPEVDVPSSLLRGLLRRESGDIRAALRALYAAQAVR